MNVLLVLVFLNEDIINNMSMCRASTKATILSLTDEAFCCVSKF